MMFLGKVKTLIHANTKILVPIAIFALVVILFLYFSSETENTQIVKPEDNQPKTAVTFKNSATPDTELSNSHKRKSEPETASKGSLGKLVDDYLPTNFRSNKNSNNKDDAAEENTLETLYSETEASAEEEGLIVAPFGRLLSCETVLTIDSSNAETPIIGLVTEDLWYEGKCIVPAGTEVHGSARAVKNRDRIVTDNEWRLVWVTKDQNNGTELPLKAVALDKDKNDLDATWSMIDGSAGLRGTVLKSDEFSEIKLFGATFLGGVIAAIQDPGGEAEASDEKPKVVKTSFNKAVSQGVSAVIERYAEDVMESIEKEGFFVRIPAGKQFYLYIQQSIDLSLIHKMK